VSVVLYMALGVVVLTIVLSAGMPLVAKLKDKNTIAQTKTLFYKIDENIRRVASEGPGSRRVLSPFEIKEGDFAIKAPDRIVWDMTTTAKIMEPCPYKEDDCSQYVIKEGYIDMLMKETQVVGENTMLISLNYTNTAELRDDSQLSPPYKGVFTFTIEHTGEYDDNGLPIISLKIS